MGLKKLMEIKLLSNKEEDN